MVLYKRKPITPLPPLKTPRLDTEVWVMPCTDEIFTSYEDFLRRLDYYKQSKFTCEITGHSNLTFFEAWESETNGLQQVDSAFPEPLREPVLRKVQFSIINRIDDLVNSLFEAFKEDFFPGEQVTCHREDTSDKLAGVIRDKASFPEVQRSDGTIERPAMSRYFITISKDPTQEALMDNKHIFRPRKTFTKQVLRSFLKNTISRERWDGAPWTVKEEFAKQYHISSTVPINLQHDNRVAEKRALAALKRGRYDGECLQFWAEQGGFPAGQQPQLSPLELLQFRQALSGLAPTFATKSGGKSQTTLSFTNHLHEYEILQYSTNDAPPPAPLTIVKYPIDDLELHPKKKVEHRPNLKFLSEDTPMQNPESIAGRQGIHMESVGPLVEVWNTLNVMGGVLALDSFTLDDFLDAMEFASEEVDCPLFVEMHCAVLALLVDSKGKSDISDDLPDVPDDQSDVDEESRQTSVVSSPTPEQAGRRVNENVSVTGRTSLPNSNNTIPRKSNDVALHGHVSHRAAEMMADYDWTDRVKDRDFKQGGWEIIMVGLLYQMSFKDALKDKCLRILSELAPINEEATQETARLQYIKLDVNLRICSLQLVTMLAIGTGDVKRFLSKSSDQMTKARKVKIDLQRQRRPLVVELLKLDEERKLHRPIDASEPPVEDASLAVDATDVNDAEESSAEGREFDDDDLQKGYLLRRISDRTAERKRKREEDAQNERKKKARIDAAATSKDMAHYRKVLKAIDKKKDEIKFHEEAIARMDGELRENNVNRTKVLGRDRFWNRYYWFERNGMPFAGDPESSTANKGYANGRLWVQGPDDIEQKGFIDLGEADMSRYRIAFGLSIRERKELEEGPTGLLNAHQWGYYDDPESLDKLIEWLDDRGLREKALKKELLNWRDTIVKYMHIANAHLKETAKKKANSEEPALGITTRTKRHIDQRRIKFPCLAWTNNKARKALGHAHAEESPQPEEKVQELKKVVSKPRGFTSVNERPATRQGTRYRG